MAGPMKSGTRVDHGAKGPRSKDMRTGDNSQPSSVGSATNAKVPVDGVENHNTSTSKAVSPETRKTTGGG